MRLAVLTFRLIYVWYEQVPQLAPSLHVQPLLQWNTRWLTKSFSMEPSRIFIGNGMNRRSASISDNLNKTTRTKVPLFRIVLVIFVKNRMDSNLIFVFIKNYILAKFTTQQFKLSNHSFFLSFNIVRILNFNQIEFHFRSKRDVHRASNSSHAIRKIVAGHGINVTRK